VAVLPIGIGLLLKKNFSITAINLILENDMFIKMPEIRLFDYIGMASLAIIFLNLLFDIPKKNVFIKKMWIFLFGTFSFLFYIYGGVLTHSKYLNQGSNTLWALLIPVVIAFAFLALFDALKIMFRFNYIGHIACYLTILSVLYYLPQNPIISDKKEYNSSVVQYLKISKTFRPTQWMIVSWQEGYSLALGSGFHMLIDDFIDSYSPENKKLININDNYKELRTEDLFIFYEKNIFYNQTVDLGYYRYKSAMKPKIFEWISKYQENHHNISLFYRDENIEVWQIHQLLDKEEIRTRIWE
jgi:hypothetical protein